MEEFEGTSARNSKRTKFITLINHLNNPNKIVSKKMNYYIKQTKEQLRDTSIDQASKELERQQIKVLRMKRNLMSIQAYRDELAEKKDLILHVRDKYPDIKFKNQDIFDHTLAEINSHIAKNLKHA